MFSKFATSGGACLLLSVAWRYCQCCRVRTPVSCFESHQDMGESRPLRAGALRQVWSGMTQSKRPVHGASAVAASRPGRVWAKGPLVTNGARARSVIDSDMIARSSRRSSRNLQLRHGADGPRRAHTLRILPQTLDRTARAVQAQPVCHIPGPNNLTIPKILTPAKPTGQRRQRISWLLNRDRLPGTGRSRRIKLRSKITSLKLVSFSAFLAAVMSVKSVRGFGCMSSFLARLSHNSQVFAEYRIC